MKEEEDDRCKEYGGGKGQAKYNGSRTECNERSGLHANTPPLVPYLRKSATSFVLAL